MFDDSWPSNDDTLQFQLEEQLHSLASQEGKLDDLSFSDSPSSPSSDEFTSDMLLTVPILDPSLTLKPGDAFLTSIISNSELLDSPDSFSFESSPLSPQPLEAPPVSSKRHHDDIAPDSSFISVKPAAKSTNKGKKAKTDSGKTTKRERNKVSAAKYRQRRKVYIDGLEDHVRQLTDQINSQNKIIETLKTENQMLKDQGAYLKKLVDSFRRGKTPVTSAPPINRAVKVESSFIPQSLPIKPVGAGLFLLVICCLIFSFQPTETPVGGSVLNLPPIRGASRTLLNVHLTNEELEHNESISQPVDPKSDYLPDDFQGTIVETVLHDLGFEPAFEEIETIAARHGSAAAA